MALTVTYGIRTDSHAVSQAFLTGPCIHRFLYMDGGEQLSSSRRQRRRERKGPARSNIFFDTDSRWQLLHMQGAYDTMTAEGPFDGSNHLHQDHVHVNCVNCLFVPTAALQRTDFGSDALAPNCEVQNAQYSSSTDGAASARM